MVCVMASGGRSGPGNATRKGRAAGRSTRPVRAAAPSGRYTPPIPREVKVSPKWLGPMILALLIVGALAIVLNYFDVLPGAPTNWYLVVGIVLIAGGFVSATRWR